MPAPPPLSGRTRVVLNVLSAALVLRLFGLGSLSLWVDEGVTWWNATHGGWKDAALAESNHPPLWWLATRAWLLAFPGGEEALRLPAVVCGLLAVVLAWRLSRRLSLSSAVPSRGGFAGGDDGATPLWVAGLAAANPFWVEYAQEARMYAALLLESLGLSLLYLRHLDRGGRGPLVAYAVLAAVALHTNYLAAWPIAGHAAHALWAARATRGSPRPFSAVPVLVAQAAAGLSFVPWFLHMVEGYRGISPGRYEPLGRLAHALWRMGVGPGIVPLDAPRVRAGPAAVFAEQPVAIVATALLWAVPIAMGARALARDRGARAFVAACVLVPTGLALAACVRWPLVHEKYLIFLAPFLLHLAVVGARAASGPLRAALLGGLVLLHAAGLLAYHGAGTRFAPAALTGGHEHGKEQWREAHHAVGVERAAGDVVLLHAPFVETAWRFYDARQGVVPATVVPPPSLPSDRALSADELLDAVPALRDAPAAWLVLSHPATADDDHYRDVLLEAAARAWGRFEVTTRELPLQWGIRVFRVRRP